MKKTAYIFMEFQRDFFTGGKLGAFQEQSLFVSHAQAILQEARAKGCPVIHVHLSFSEDYAELREDVNGVLALVKQAQAFHKGSSGAEALVAFAPKEKELCIYKSSISAFERTDLQEYLQEMGVTDLVFSGLLSNICIESSVREAYDKGYRVSVVKDACSTLDEKGHVHAMEHILPLFSTVI
jgi:nicotinamidase-related amidase